MSIIERFSTCEAIGLQLELKKYFCDISYEGKLLAFQLESLNKHLSINREY